mmetsp:Transcript_34463/g.34089  ORF Transcript_34463/g.34089 Transcript_34463/m.34089 type:complete len:176 (+) Transcript_34463:32-559(+)|eukprot:CAMPEP_0197003662 /NCGR_PEP_ID=MMETSP1380-20130617/10982_1 /TAXON_ID=5936 /ORGANISM="Euplotes crassus, Strain CT5" /LENGTH=175 /DNA_ID=CAMNT_0042422233 /DNA_START=25 /DNA_END=552 /DNA_ORIENTATION=+
MVIVGDATVGKSAIVNQLVNQSFNSAYSMTQACDYKIKEFPIEESKTVVELHILDIAGQKFFNNIAIELIKDVTHVMLVYDMTNPDTFNSLQSWFDGIKEENPGKDIKGWLVGNKADLETRIKITTDDGQAFASEAGLRYFEVSAMKYEDVEAPFKEAAELFHETYEERIKKISR